ERAEDIPLLAAHFVEKHARRAGKAFAGLHEQAISRLLHYSWPGNIRGLENAIERAVVLSTGTWITRDAIVLRTATPRSATAPSPSRHQNVEWIERETIRRVLELSDVKRQAARAMGISPRALAYYLNKYPALDEQRRLSRRPDSATAFRMSDEQPVG